MNDTTSLLGTGGGGCPPEECDTFQFMAKRLQVKVLHPGGLDATDTLARKCGITSNTMLLDVGCGRGSTSVHLANRYGCKVVGVDVDRDLLLEAQRLALAKGAAGGVAFRLGDIHALPFENGTFDVALVQAVLIFTRKRTALKQLYDKIRPGGLIGVDELAWRMVPSERMRQNVARTLCGAAVNAEEFEGWADLLRDAGFVVDYAEAKEGGFSFKDMFRNEGLLPTLGIMARTITESDVRERLRGISRLFEETHEYLGYGLYVGRKE